MRHRWRWLRGQRSFPARMNAQLFSYLLLEVSPFEGESPTAVEKLENSRLAITFEGLETRTRVFLDPAQFWVCRTCADGWTTSGCREPHVAQTRMVRRRCLALLGKNTTV